MKKLAVILILLSSLTAQTNNGWHITTRYYYTHESHSSARIEQVFLMNGYMKMVTGELTTIFDLNKAELFYINTNNRRYWKGTPKQFNAEVRADLEIMIDKQLYGMEEEQQEAMRAIYKEMLSASFSDSDDLNTEPRSFVVRKDKEGERVSGFLATSYKIFEDNLPLENIWISEELPIAQDFDFISLSHFLNQLASGAYATSFESTQEYFNLIEKGYPVKVEMYRSDGTIQVSEVIEAKLITLTTKDFAIPKGYSTGTLSDVGVWDGYR